MKKRTDTITVKTRSGRIKTKYKKICVYCKKEFFAWRESSICCNQTHYLNYAYSTGLRDHKTIALKANQASKEKGYAYRLNNPIYAVYGPAHHAWKGGITPQTTKERDRFRKTIGREVLKRDNYKCQICGNTGYLNVDHIKDWAKYPKLRFNPDNCITLCVECHYKKTYGRKMPIGLSWGRKFS